MPSGPASEPLSSAPGDAFSARAPGASSDVGAGARVGVRPPAAPQAANRPAAAPVAWWSVGLATLRRLRGTSWASVTLEGARFWLISRIAFFLSAYVIVLSGRILAGKGGEPLNPRTFINTWVVWDGVYYLHIARNGYVDYGNAVFFPLYPMLIRVVALGSSHYALAGLIVSALATLVGCVGVVALLRFEGWLASQRDAALRALFAFPFAFFFGVILSESVFFACVVWTLYCARRGWWLRAALVGSLAGLARPTALALLPVIAWEAFRQTSLGAVKDAFARRALPQLRLSWRAVRVDGLVACALAGVPVGYGLFMLYCGHHYGDPLAMVHAQASWHHMALAPWDAIARNATLFNWQLNTHPWQYDELRTISETGSLLVVLIITALGALGVGLRTSTGASLRAPLAYTLFSLALIATVMASPQVEGPHNSFAYFGSAYRYMLLALPAWFTVGYWMSRWRWLDFAWTTAGLLLQAALLGLFLLAGYAAFIG